MTHEIPKSLCFLIECIPQERKISAGELFNVPLSDTTGHLRKQQSKDKGACVVIGAIAFPVIRHIKNSVLENPGVVGHPKEVIEFERRQFIRTILQSSNGKGFARRNS